MSILPLRAKDSYLIFVFKEKKKEKQHPKTAGS